MAAVTAECPSAHLNRGKLGRLVKNVLVNRKDFLLLFLKISVRQWHTIYNITEWPLFFAFGKNPFCLISYSDTFDHKMYFGHSS